MADFLSKMKYIILKILSLAFIIVATSGNLTYSKDIIDYKIKFEFEINRYAYLNEQWHTSDLDTEAIQALLKFEPETEIILLNRRIIKKDKSFAIERYQVKFRDDEILSRYIENLSVCPSMSNEFMFLLTEKIVNYSVRANHKGLINKLKLYKIKTTKFGCAREDLSELLDQLEDK